MRIWLILVATAVVATPLHAQAVPVRSTERKGFWAGAGLGVGSIGQSCSGCSSNRAGGPAGYIRLGGTLSQKVLLGVELAGWSMDALGARQSVGTGMIDLFWYPSRDGGFYLKFGLGGLGYERVHNTTQVKTTETAAAASFGLGYDIRVTDNISIVPFFNGYGSSKLKQKVNGVETMANTGVTRDMLQIGLGVTLH